MVDADDAMAIGLGPVGLDEGQVQKRDPVVLVVIGQESERAGFWNWTLASNTVSYQCSICSKRRVR
jgi:hypothetical protein